MIKILGLASLLALAACGLFEEKRKPIPRAALSLIQTANLALRSGDFATAEQVVKQLKDREDPDGVLEEPIQVLEKSYYARKISTEIREHASLVVEPERAAAGAQVKIVLTLKNPGEHPLHFLGGGLEEDTGRGLVGRFLCISVEYDAFGNSIRNQSIESFALDETVSLEPGQEWAQISFIPVAPLESFAVREYGIVCELKGTQAKYGEMELNLPTTAIGPTPLMVFPRGFEQIEKNPLEGLEKALDKSEERFSRHIIIASALMPETDKKAAVRLCMSHLGNHAENRNTTVMAALRWLTGESISPKDEVKWRKWWEENQGDYEEGD